MQLRFREKEQFFHETAQMLQSGIPFERVLECLGRGRGRAAAAARRMAPLANGGIGAAFRAGGFSEEDAEMLDAGEQSGRIGEACRELEKYYGQLALGRQRVIAASCYPVFILHLGALLLSLPSAVAGGGAGEFIIQVTEFLGAAYLLGAGAIASIWVLAKAFEKNPVACWWVGRIPVLGGFLRDAALARYCLVLSLGIRSAGGVLSSLTRAGRASRSACLAKASDAAVEAIRGGRGFADSLVASGAFPEDLEQAFHVAEASGRLDEEISRWAHIFGDRMAARIESLAEWFPRALYILVVAAVVLRMFSVIFQITGAVTSALDF